MARLRFPGRPGYRYDRLWVRYGVDEHRKDSDRTTKLIANIQRGLQYFIELFGESDEDDDFDGFTAKEIKQAEKKCLDESSASFDSTTEANHEDEANNNNQVLGGHIKEYPRNIRHGDLLKPRAVLQASKLGQKHIQKAFHATVEKGLLQHSQNLKQRLLSREHVTQPAEPGRGRKKLIGISKDEVPKKRGLGRPPIKRVSKDDSPKKTVRLGRPPRPMKKVKLKGGAEGKVPGRQSWLRGIGRTKEAKTLGIKSKHKLKSDAIVEKRLVGRPRIHPIRDKTLSPKQRGRPRLKPLPTDKSLPSAKKLQASKQLLERAKKGHLKNESKLSGQSLENTSKDLSTTGLKIRRPDFILPNISSRRARRIIPTKRYLEDEFTVISPKRPRKDDCQPHDRPFLADNDTPGVAMSPEYDDRPDHITDTPNRKSEWFDSPLVLQGKRDRKPSMKLILKLSEDTDITRRRGPKRKTETNSPPSNKSSPDSSCLSVGDDSFSDGERTKDAGQNILRKAKLRLNQVALNRSKAALVRSLGKQMKREGDQQRREADLKDFSTPLSISPPEQCGSNHPQFGRSPLNTRMSPIKFETMKDTAGVKFGLSNLPQVPKFALQSTTASLPTFQTTQLKQAGDRRKVSSMESSPSSSSDPAVLSPKEKAQLEKRRKREEFLRERLERKKKKEELLRQRAEKRAKRKCMVSLLGASCIVCGLMDSPKLERRQGVVVCSTCRWIYRKFNYQQVRTGNWAFLCRSKGSENEGKCTITENLTKDDCYACTLEKCNGRLPPRLRNLAGEKEAIESWQDKLKSDESLPNRDRIQEIIDKWKSITDVQQDVYLNRNICIICGDPRPLSERLLGYPCCTCCPRFYYENTYLISKEHKEFVCSKQGNCEIQYKSKADNCVACRYERCRKFFPPPDRLLNNEKLVQQINEKFSGTKKHTKDEANTNKQPLRIVQGQSPRVKDGSKVSSGKPAFSPKGKDGAKLMEEGEIRVECETTRTENQEDIAPTSQPDISVCQDTSPSENALVDNSAAPKKKRGPRIKHVCRRQSVALGTRAVFGMNPITLSALPQMEKDRLLKDEDRPGTPDSDDLTLDQIIRQARDEKEDGVHIRRTSPAKPSKLISEKLQKPLKSVKRSAANKYKKFTLYKRTFRCKKCPGCVRPDCEKCVYCQDMKKFGGPGTIRRACKFRKCVDPICGRKGKLLVGHDVAMELKEEAIDSDDDGPDSAKKRKNREDSAPGWKRGSPKSPGKSGGQPGGKKCAEPGAGSTSKKLSKETSGRLLTKTFKEKDTLTVHKPVTQRKKWPSSGEENHTIKIDFQEEYDMDVAWERGVPLIASEQICLRTVCLLCGCAGQHELIYCNVCCEPFHRFCLEDHERPLRENLHNWCCRRCQYCHVCGRQNHLLKCDKCQETYHPECLGPNYPTRLSKIKHIWVCTKCVRCKSCGATTPGKVKDAVWMYDFSLCYECGLLKEKGNFCPVCHKCYYDDDWESKMIQCSRCESWVHAKCEGLSDEMYHIVSYMPDDVPFNCRVCSPLRPSMWRGLVDKEMKVGFDKVLDSLFSCKNVHHLESIPEQELPSSRPSSRASSRPPSRAQDTKQETTTQDGVNVCGVSGRTDRSSIRKLGHESAQLPLPMNSCGQTSHMTREATLAVNAVSLANSVQTEDVSSQETRKVTSAIGAVIPEDSGEHGTNKREIAENQMKSNQNSSLEADSKATEKVNNELSTVAGNDGPRSCSDNTDMICDSSQRLSNVDNRARSELNSESGLVNYVSSGSQMASSGDTSATSAPVAMDTEQNEMFVAIDPELMEQLSKASPDGTPQLQIAVDDLINLMSPGGDLPQTPVSQQKGTEIFPRDLKLVKSKFGEGRYSTVMEFSDDIIRIIQYNLSQENRENMTQVKKKPNSAIRSRFIKEMQNCFPWFDVKASRLWKHNQNLPEGMLPDAVLPPSDDHTYAQWLERESSPKSPQVSPFKRPLGNVHTRTSSADSPKNSSLLLAGGEMQMEVFEDTRICVFCGNHGDDKPNDCGRLLYLGHDDWAHVNCALWAAEVYEEVDGTLQNVHAAMTRGIRLTCNACGKKGATVGCNKNCCLENFHYLCARRARCIFQEDKKMFCYRDRNYVDSKIIDVNKFAMLRRACVEVADPKYIKKYSQIYYSPRDVTVLAGSMTVESLGKLTPVSDCNRILFPIDYCVTRIYWSTLDARRRCVYTCRVIEGKPTTPSKRSTRLMKDITIIHDKTHPQYDARLDRKYKVARRKSVDKPAITPPPRSTGSSRDLSFLSPKTLELLNHSDLTKYTNKVTEVRSDEETDSEDELALVELAGRLNKGASSRHRRRASWDSNTSSGSREGSVERSSGKRRMVRSGSIEIKKLTKQNRGIVIKSITEETSHVTGTNATRSQVYNSDDCQSAIGGRSSGVSVSGDKYHRSGVQAETVYRKVNDPTKSPIYDVTASATNRKHTIQVIDVSGGKSSFEPNRKSYIVEQFSGEAQNQDKTPRVSSNLIPLSAANHHQGASVQGDTRTSIDSISQSKTYSFVSRSHSVPGKDILTLGNLAHVAQTTKSGFQVAPATGDKKNSQTANTQLYMPSTSQYHVSVSSSHVINTNSSSANVHLYPSSQTDGTDDHSTSFKCQASSDLHVSNLIISEDDSERLNTAAFSDLQSSGSGLLTEKTVDVESVMSEVSDLDPSDQLDGVDDRLDEDPNARSQTPGSETVKSSLRDVIVERIKAQSLARSLPSEEGPLKCPKCKRLYRTRESFQKHVTECSFEVSSEDDEDEEEQRSNSAATVEDTGTNMRSGSPEVVDLTGEEAADTVPGQASVDRTSKPDNSSTPILSNLERDNKPSLVPEPNSFTFDEEGTSRSNLNPSAYVQKVIANPAPGPVVAEIQQARGGTTHVDYHFSSASLSKTAAENYGRTSRDQSRTGTVVDTSSPDVQQTKIIHEVNSQPTLLSAEVTKNVRTSVAGESQIVVTGKSVTQSIEMVTGGTVKNRENPNKVLVTNQRANKTNSMPEKLPLTDSQQPRIKVPKSAGGDVPIFQLSREDISKLKSVSKPSSGRESYIQIAQKTKKPMATVAPQRQATVPERQFVRESSQVIQTQNPPQVLTTNNYVTVVQGNQVVQLPSQTQFPASHQLTYLGNIAMPDGLIQQSGGAINLMTQGQPVQMLMSQLGLGLSPQPVAVQNLTVSPQSNVVSMGVVQNMPPFISPQPTILTSPTQQVTIPVSPQNIQVKPVLPPQGANMVPPIQVSYSYPAPSVQTCPTNTMVEAPAVAQVAATGVTPLYPVANMSSNQLLQSLDQSLRAKVLESLTADNTQQAPQVPQAAQRQQNVEYRKPTNAGAMTNLLKRIHSPENRTTRGPLINPQKRNITYYVGSEYSTGNTDGQPIGQPMTAKLAPTPRQPTAITNPTRLVKPTASSSLSSLASILKDSRPAARGNMHLAGRSHAMAEKDIPQSSASLLQQLAEKVKPQAKTSTLQDILESMRVETSASLLKDNREKQHIDTSSLERILGGAGFDTSVSNVRSFLQKSQPNKPEGPGFQTTRNTFYRKYSAGKLIHNKRKDSRETSSSKRLQSADGGLHRNRSHSGREASKKPLILTSQKSSTVRSPRKQRDSVFMQKLDDITNDLLSSSPGKFTKKHIRKEYQKDDLGHNEHGFHAHPMIHPHSQQPFLPPAEVEEEVVETPLYTVYDEKDLKSRDKKSKPDSPYLIFEITSEDGFKVRAKTCQEAWKAVTDKVQDARASARMKQLSYGGVNGLHMFGLDSDPVVYLLEQLFGAWNCRNYKFRYHAYERDDLEEPEENASGCARTEPFSTRKDFEIFSFLLSKYRKAPRYESSGKKEEEMVLKSQRRATSMGLPMAMRFRHLKETSKEAVGVYRSKIDGRGLFCKRNIDAGEMVIEYAGEIIRSSLCDKRERYYESKGIGCYMFRINDDEVVDATIKGSAARFINHSCDPNCYSRIVNIDGRKHIVIFALRPIKKGEELTYDYKFPIEEVKIPCTCNSKRCRKYLN